MKNQGILALFVGASLVACGGSSGRTATAYKPGDFPMRSSETWSALWLLDKQEVGVVFQLKSTPAIDSDGDVSASLNVSGSGAEAGVGYIDNSDGTFVVTIKIKTLRFTCYAPLGSNWGAAVVGKGVVSVNSNNPTALPCAMGKNIKIMGK